MVTSVWGAHIKRPQLQCYVTFSPKTSHSLNASRRLYTICNCYARYDICTRFTVLHLSALVCYLIGPPEGQNSDAGSFRTLSDDFECLLLRRHPHTALQNAGLLSGYPLVIRFLFTSLLFFFSSFCDDSNSFFLCSSFAAITPERKRGWCSTRPRNSFS